MAADQEKSTVWNDEKTAGFRKLGVRPLAKIFDHTLLSYMGDVTGKSIMDIGCGEGRFCRTLKSKGASRVVGVDVSAGMLESAQEGDKAKFGCEYLLGNATTLGKIGEFDFVTSSGLMPFAESVSDLIDMVRTFYENLKPGGKLLSINVNCQNDDWGGTFARYASSTVTRLPPTDGGRRMKSTIKLQDGDVFTVIFHYYEPNVYERVFKDAGFRSFSLKPILVKYGEDNNFPEGYWDLFLSKPSHLCYFAEK